MKTVLCRNILKYTRPLVIIRFNKMARLWYLLRRSVPLNLSCSSASSGLVCHDNIIRALSHLVQYKIARIFFHRVSFLSPPSELVLPTFIFDQCYDLLPLAHAIINGGQPLGTSPTDHSLAYQRRSYAAFSEMLSNDGETITSLWLLLRIHTLTKAA